MKTFSTFVPFCALSLQLQPALAFWRMACSISQTSRIDPILSPGTVSGHVHKFAGGNNVDQSSTHQTLQASTCSTCEVQSDKSAYWTPQLYYQYSDGTIEEVQNDGMTVYYVGRGGDSSNTVPFPDGFKMISGNSLLRHYDTQKLTYMDTRPIADRVSFRCINEANNIPETHYINDTNCVNGLRAQINFQSCWDGVNLYKEGNTHVAYLSGIDYGVCPPTHPVPIPGLFYEVLYWSNRIDQSKGGRFVFSNGDTTGYGFHGDFLNGWDQNVQAQAVKDCLYSNGDSDGVVSACSALASSDDVNFARTCPESLAVMPEAIKGVLPSNQLPGCNPITSGPSDSTQIVCALNSTTPITGGTSLSSQSTVESTTVTLSTPGVSLASSTEMTTAQITSTDSTTTTDLIVPPASFTSLLSSTTSTTAPAALSTSTSVETVTTPTWTRSGRPWNSQSYSTFTRSYTGHYGEPQSIGGIFVTVSSVLSSNLALSTSSCATADTVTTTVTVTFSESSTNSGTSDLASSGVQPSTPVVPPISVSSGVSAFALLTITTTEIITADTSSTAFSEASSTSLQSPFMSTESLSTPTSSLTVLQLTATPATNVITTVIATTGSEILTPLSSMPLSAYFSHAPVQSPWSNVSASWSNFSYPTATTLSSSSTSILTSFARPSQSSSNQLNQSSPDFDQSTSMTTVVTDAASSAATTVPSSTASVDSSTIAGIDSSIPPSSTPFYTGTITSGTTTTLVTVFVPVSIAITSAADATPTVPAVSVAEVASSTSTLEKREAENQRLKAFVTFRLRGREVIMEKSG